MGVYASILGTLITCLLAGLGVLGYFTVVRRTKAEAQESAKEWFDENAKQLKEQISKLETKVNAAHQSIANTVAGVHEHGQSAKERLERAVQMLQNQMDDRATGDPKALQEAQAVVTDHAEELKKLAENSYSFDDWNARAHAAYAANQLEEAALYWLKASQIPNAGSIRVAQALLCRCITQEQLEQNSEAIATCEDLLHRFGDATEQALHEQVGAALLTKGIAQGKLSQNAEAIATYDDLLCRLSDATEPILLEIVIKALCNKGNAQHRLGQYAQAIATYDELLRNFGDAIEPTLREQVAKALLNKGWGQSLLGQNAEAVSTYDNILLRFGDATELALREYVAKALFNKGVSQDKLGQSEKAIATYDDLLHRFGDATELALCEEVAKALLNKAADHHQLEQNPQAIATYDDLLRRFDVATELVLREKVAMTLFSRGLLQTRLGQNPEAVATFNELLHRFGEAVEPSLCEHVASALNSLGCMDLREAKAKWVDTEVASKLLHQALDRFNHAMAKMGEPWGMALSNRAYVQWLLGNAAQAEVDYAAALRASKDGGLGLYERTLQFFFILPIPEDQGMRDLVDRLWSEYKANP